MKQQGWIRSNKGRWKDHFRETAACRQPYCIDTKRAVNFFACLYFFSFFSNILSIVLVSNYYSDRNCLNSQKYLFGARGHVLRPNSQCVQMAAKSIYVCTWGQFGTTINIAKNASMSRQFPLATDKHSSNVWTEYKSESFFCIFVTHSRYMELIKWICS